MPYRSSGHTKKEARSLQPHSPNAKIETLDTDQGRKGPQYGGLIEMLRYFLIRLDPDHKGVQLRTAPTPILVKKRPQSSCLSLAEAFDPQAWVHCGFGGVGFRDMQCGSLNNSNKARSFSYARITEECKLREKGKLLTSVRTSRLLEGAGDLVSWLYVGL